MKVRIIERSYSATDSDNLTSAHLVTDDNAGRTKVQVNRKVAVSMIDLDFAGAPQHSVRLAQTTRPGAAASTWGFAI